MTTSIRIEGLNELMDDLERAWAQVDARGGEKVGEVAKKIEATAKEIVPIGPTGNLQRSIHTSGKGTFREIGPSEHYGRFVEFGTWKDQPPQPFMGPAADRHENELITELERLIGEL